MRDLTNSYTTLGIWGPNARLILEKITSGDVSNEGFKFSTCKTIEIDTLRVLASRISYVGDLGWELYIPIEQGEALWDRVWEAGKEFGLIPVGIGVYGTTGRLEKAYRAFGNELESDFNSVEAGMTTPKVKAQDFVGKAALLAQREAGPQRVCCSLTVDDNTSSTGEKRYMLGREPLLTLDGKTIKDPAGHHNVYVTSAGSAPSLGKHVLMAYLPLEHAVEGTKLLVEYLGEQYPATVARVGAKGLFDENNDRIMS